MSDRKLGLRLNGHARFWLSAAADGRLRPPGRVRGMALQAGMKYLQERQAAFKRDYGAGYADVCRERKLGSHSYSRDAEPAKRVQYIAPTVTFNDALRFALDVADANPDLGSVVKVDHVMTLAVEIGASIIRERLLDLPLCHPDDDLTESDLVRLLDI